MQGYGASKYPPFPSLSSAHGCSQGYFQGRGNGSHCVSKMQWVEESKFQIADSRSKQVATNGPVLKDSFSNRSQNTNYKVPQSPICNYDGTFEFSSDKSITRVFRVCRSSASKSADLKCSKDACAINFRASLGILIKRTPMPRGDISSSGP